MGSCASTEGRRNRDRARQEKKEKSVLPPSILGLCECFIFTEAARKKVKKFCKGHKDQYKLKSKPSTNIGKVDVRISGQFFQLRTAFYLSDSSLVDGLLQVRFCSSKQ